MAETKSSLPAQLVRDVTSAIWRHVQQQAEGPLARDGEVRRIMDRDKAGNRLPELRALIDRIDALAPAEQKRFTAAIDDVQVASKLWLIDALSRRRDLAGTTVFILGAWYGTLALLLNWRLAPAPDRMVCIDIDPDACALGESVIGSIYPNIRYEVADVMKLDYERLTSERPTVLVNTVCEHLPDTPGWWRLVPNGQLTVLQTNNYEACPDHVNCVQSLEEMNAQSPLSEPMFERVLHLPIFDRFMLIGHR